ncbi:MAG: peptidylprolyl isomerase [Nitrospinota bacterium]
MEQLGRAAGILSLLGALAIGPLGPGAGTAKAQTAPKVVVLGKRVSIEYTLVLPDKTKVDSNVGEAPLTYTQGSDEILPRLQAALLGLKEGESKEVTLKPEEAYGAVDPKAFLEVKKALIPENLREQGKQLVGRDPSGRLQRFRVHEIKEETIVLDFNHPLAGKTLIFTVKVVKVE